MGRDGVFAGRLIESVDAGRTWHRLTAPDAVQSECFQDGQTGWIATRHGIYATVTGGRRWREIGRDLSGTKHAPSVTLQCAGRGVAWALAVGPGAASSQSPHIGYRLSTTTNTPLFAEQYFPHPEVKIANGAAGSYAGPFSAISPDAAAFVDWCPACGAGTAPWLIAGNDPRSLTSEGDVGRLTNPTAAGFTSTTAGCVAGLYNRWRKHDALARIVCTSDGKHWAVTWQR
jgi:hypothetical protein